MAMEEQIEKLRDDYFSFDGAMKQIGKFMLHGSSNSNNNSNSNDDHAHAHAHAHDTSELICRALPSDSGSGHKETSPCVE